MGKLLKYLKDYWVSVLAIVVLLIIQAVCDLSLPQYNANIINVGIQAGGVENAVPKAIRKSEMERLMLFMDEEQTETVLKEYFLLDAEETDTQTFEEKAKEYPQLRAEPVYELREHETQETIDTLQDIFLKPMMITYGFESGSDQMAAVEAQLKASLPAEMASMDIFQIFASMPKEQLQQMLEEINRQLSEMPVSILEQSGQTFVKSEYQQLGMNTDNIQNQYILLAGIQMLAIALAGMLASISVGFLASRVAARQGRDLRKRVFGKVISFSSVEFDKFSTASLITRSTNDIQQIQLLMVMMLRIVFYAPIMAIGGVIKVLNTDTSMSWIIGLAAFIIILIVLTLFIIVMPKFKLMQKLLDKVNLVAREILTGIPVIRAFSTEKYEEQRFEKANRNLMKTNLFVNRVMTCMMPLMMLVMNGISILIVWSGADSINQGEMQVGDLMAFIQYTMQIIMSFLMISMVSVMLPRATVSAGRIDEILVSKTAIKDPAISKSGNPEQKGVLEFKNVSFRYPNAEEDALSNLNFTAKPGETTAFIGSTGSGKSTLLNLIPRFYDVSEGQILMDGVDIREWTQHDLREKIGYVPQKGVLFSGSIASNLKYGGEQITDQDMKQAAEVAQATEFILEKPDQYESAIAQGGTNVSGGQKQRLSIARAIAKKPNVYLFDDSFSALDYKTDVTLRKALKQHTANSTVLIVAQRISTILNAEQIIVLDEGKIIGKGTHQELLKSCEVYQQIALSQLSKEELENE